MNSRIRTQKMQLQHTSLVRKTMIQVLLKQVFFLQTQGIHIFQKRSVFDISKKQWTLKTK